MPHPSLTAAKVHGPTAPDETELAPAPNDKLVGLLRFCHNHDQPPAIHRDNPAI